MGVIVGFGEKQTRMGSSFGFLKYGGKARIGSGRGEEKKIVIWDVYLE